MIKEILDAITSLFKAGDKPTKPLPPSTPRAVRRAKKAVLEHSEVGKRLINTAGINGIFRRK